MPSTWNAKSRLVYGETLPMTEHREEFVAHVILGLWVQQGYTDAQIALMWNQGHPGTCKSGVNKHGVSYDSCAYRNKVLAQL